MESNQNSEYVQDDEGVDLDLNVILFFIFFKNKEPIYKKQLTLINKRPHTTQVGKNKNSTRYALRARDKK